MDVIFIAALLFILSGVVHAVIPFIYGKGPTTVPVIIYAVLYLAFGSLLLLGISWVVPVALVLTFLGLIGASVTLKSVPEQRKITLCMNALDVIMIGLLGASYF